MKKDRFPTYAHIDRSAIVHNCNVFRKRIPGGCKICVAAKCNGYGHGVDACLPAFEQAGVEMLCVALIDEAAQLKEAGWDRPILLLGSEFSIYEGSQRQQMARWIVENDLRISAVYQEDILTLAETAEKLNTPATIHLMLDTGMSRMGLSEDEVYQILERFKNNSNLVIEGLYTHFATADETDKDFAEYQLKRLNGFLQRLDKNNVSIPIIHAANSGAALDIPASCFNMVRPGISAYGYHASPQMTNKPDLKPAMKVVSHLTLIKRIPKGAYIGYGCTCQAERDMLIGLVPVGYGDGYDRRLSNYGSMIVNECWVRVIGRVSMDQTIVDLTELHDKGVAVRPGDAVTVIDNRRESPNSVESLAVYLQTVPNEIVTTIGPRIKRISI